ncbi:hypothetical protein K493DRAFT_332378 [Basidiobolus meristosporus CBS 931.73]|uniref:Uncharacterized protein n=1 Tax=Basidiobolus meristosporus CBS 931.73 TaxID=1314790 RepID=A0A1Y1ZDR3_9FUNG|nr:hypothetical protein K493DRAFT_332378 [Basidiobolus meristosporus CBS 931.73]|eukprot:ORY08432.1 hypothetical protein K493DRAFT_332378 [Basidiobolus meristosporus CBS 931.73]
MAALRILCWLARGPFQEILRKVLIDQLQGSDKRSKLGVVLLLDHLLNQTPTGPSAIVGIQEVDENQEGFFSTNAAVLLISALSSIARRDSKLTDDGGVQPTTLTTTAVTVALHISRKMITAKEKDLSEVRVIGVVQELIPMVKQVQQWYHSHHALLCAGLEEVVNLLEGCTKASIASHTSIEVWWPWVSRYLDPRNLTLSRNAIQRHIEKLFAKENDELLDAHYRLVCCALFLGYRDECFWLKIHDWKATDGIGVDKAFLRLIEAVINSPGPGHPAAFSMLKTFIERSGDSQLTLESVLSHFLTLLDEDDAISEAAINFIADHFSLLPDEILHHTMKRLDSEELLQQKNAMRLLERIFRFISTTLSAEMKNSLQERLFDRMGSERVELRNLAARLLAHFDPLDTFSKLSIRLVSPDAALRASAGSAITLMLNEHSRNAEGILSLLDLLRNLSKLENSTLTNPGSTPPSNPGQIFGIERLFDLIRKWTDSVPDQLWSSLVKPLLRKSYAFPKDTILIRFWNTISEALGRNPDAVDAVISEITNTLISQPNLALLTNDEAYSRLTKEMLDSNSEESSLEMQALLFLRLHPLLVLKTLPGHCFEQVALSSSFGSQIRERCSEDLEFPQIRTIAMEILSRVPESIRLIADQLDTLCNALQKDFLNTKQWVFGFCQWLIQTFNRKHSLDKQETGIVQQVISSYFKTLLQWKSTDENLHKLQLGCMDTLSLTLMLSGTELLKTTCSIVEIDDEQIEPIFEFTLHFILRNLSLHENEEQMSTCMANVIVMTVKRLSNQPLGTTGPAAKVDFDKDRLKAFADRTIATLMSTVSMAADEPKHTIAGAACLQALFHYSYLIPEHINRGALIELAVMGIRSSELQLRVGSLKLLMSLLAASATEQVVDYTLSPVVVQQIREGIHALRGSEDVGAGGQELTILMDKLERILDSH